MVCDGVGLGAGVVVGGFSVGVGVGAGADDEVVDGVGCGAGALLEPDPPPAGALLPAELLLPGVEPALRAPGDWLAVWWLLAPCFPDGLALGLADEDGLADGVVDVEVVVVAVEAAE